MDARPALEVLLLALAWAAALAVGPWRLLKPWNGQVPLATPFLATLTLLPWLWSWPGLASLPLPLHWSGAPLAVLLVGWPLAVPLITIAGASTMLTLGHAPLEALSLTVWSGLLPATLVLLLGHGARKVLGTNPASYVLGRGFLVPILALGACGACAALLGKPGSAAGAELQGVVIALMSMGEASWSCAVVSVLVAWRPQWLATWSERMYLGRPARARAPALPPRR